MTGGREEQLQTWRSLPGTPTARVVGIAALLGGAYAIGALLPFWYLTSPAAGAAFFPPAGLTLSALVLTPRRYWPLLLVVVGTAELAVDITHGQSLGMALGFALANTIEPFVGATLILRFGEWGSTVRRHFVVFLGYGAVVGPAAGAFVGATVAQVGGVSSSWISTFGKWWLGDAIGVLVLASAVFAWTFRIPHEQRCRFPEMAAMVVVATGITIVPAVLWHHPMLYAVLPVLMWAALRGGWRAVTLAGIGVAFAADWATVTGRVTDLLAAGSTTQQLTFVQLFIAVTLLAALALTDEVSDRRRAEHFERLAYTDRSQAERAAISAAGDERHRIARETHDIVGHALSVMLLQAGAARRVMSTDEAMSKELLESIEGVGREAFRDLDL